jgi:hypothetical protein
LAVEGLNIFIKIAKYIDIEGTSYPGNRINIFIKIAKYIDTEGASCHCNRRVKYFFKNIL